MKTIPRFSHEETGDIELLLKDAGIPFENESVTISAGSYSGAHEYLFHIPDEFYSAAIMIIRKYYGLIEHHDNEMKLEYCPGCNSKVLDSKGCSECGLSFSYEPEEEMREHAFYIYLKQQNLI